MPILQSRLIRLIAHADSLIEQIDAISRLLKALEIEQTMVKLNSAIAHEADGPAKEALALARSSFGLLQDYFSRTPIKQSLRDEVAEERIHFKKHRKSNDYLAQYRRYKAQSEREMEGTLATMPLVIDSEIGTDRDTTRDTTRDTITNAIFSPEDRAYQEQMRKALVYEEEAKERKRIREIEKAKEEAITKEPIVENKTHTSPALSGAAYKDPNVLSTSTPSLEELNAIPIAPNKDVF